MCLQYFLASERTVRVETLSIREIDGTSSFKMSLINNEDVILLQF